MAACCRASAMSSEQKKRLQFSFGGASSLPNIPWRISACKVESEARSSRLPMASLRSIQWRPLQAAYAEPADVLVDASKPRFEWEERDPSPFDCLEHEQLAPSARAAAGMRVVVCDHGPELRGRVAHAQNKRYVRPCGPCYKRIEACSHVYRA
eukprot:scaffold53556_cov32-Tisochrysis_lutea.AAC.1